MKKHDFGVINVGRFLTVRLITGSDEEITLIFPSFPAFSDLKLDPSLFRDSGKSFYGFNAAQGPNFKVERN